MSRLPQESSLHTEVAGSASPDAFGSFRVLHQIGAGALGPVFRAYEPDQDRLAAIKVFRLDLPPERAHQLVAEFERLIEADLSHPALTSARATGLTGVIPYFAQEFVSGDSLDIVMRQGGPMPLHEALRVARQLAEGLEHAAELGFEHGAIHPRDILVPPDATRSVKLVGLGVTRALERIGAAVPIRRPYTAPERLEGAAWDRRADVFSLAAVLHELLWGRRIVGTGMHAVESMTPLPGTHLVALQAVFARALADQPVDRFATAPEFLESLESATGEASPATSRDLRAVERRHVEPAVEPLLPLEDEAEWPEPADAEPVIQLRDSEAVVSAREEPQLLLAREPLEPREPLRLREPLEPREPLELPEPPEPLEPRPSFLAPASPPVVSDSQSSSSVWPIGLAWVVGVAVGFGAGYTVAVRARVPAPPAASTSTASPAPSASSPARVLTQRTESAPPEANMPPARAIPVTPAFSGRVLVRSTPAGARVFVDGRDQGSTPATVRDLAAGDHQIRIVRDGYTAAERRVVLSKSRPSQSLTVPLAKAPAAPKRGRPEAVSTKPSGIQSAKSDAEAAASTGNLVVESRPDGATVIIDGKAVGRTPLKVSDVKAGEHAVRLDLDGHRPWTGSVKVVGGAPTRVGASLEK